MPTTTKRLGRPVGTESTRRPLKTERIPLTLPNDVAEHFRIIASDLGLPSASHAIRQLVCAGKSIESRRWHSKLSQLEKIDLS